MLYSLRQLLHKIGLHSGPGVQPGGEEESAVRDRNESISATDNAASTPWHRHPQRAAHVPHSAHPCSPVYVFSGYSTACP